MVGSVTNGAASCDSVLTDTTAQVVNSINDSNAAKNSAKSIALKSVVGSLTNEGASSDMVLTDTTAQIAAASQFGPVKTFMDECKEKQIKLVLKWIVEPTELSDILSGNQQIRKITYLLDGMLFNGYLRLFDIDLSMIKKYFTPISWTMLESYKANHKDDNWVCPQCRRHFKSADGKWKCERCLFWYHEKCSKPQEAKRSDSDVLFCCTCFFNL